MSKVQDRWQRIVPRLERHAEWIFVIVTLLASFGATRQSPDADPDAYIVGTFGVETLMIAFYLLWLVRGTRRDDLRGRDAGRVGRGRRGWIAWAGVPAAIMVVALPDLLTGHLRDEQTGTTESVFLFALILLVGVFVGAALGAMVLLPVAWILRTTVLALAGKSKDAPLIVLALLPLVFVAFAISGAIALDNAPLTDSASVFNTDAVTALGADGFAATVRAFGVDNGVRIVDTTALMCFRIFAAIIGCYLVFFLAAGLSGTRKMRLRAATG